MKWILLLEWDESLMSNHSHCPQIYKSEAKKEINVWMRFISVAFTRTLFYIQRVVFCLKQCF